MGRKLRTTYRKSLDMSKFSEELSFDTLLDEGVQDGDIDLWDDVAEEDISEEDRWVALYIEDYDAIVFMRDAQVEFKLPRDRFENETASSGKTYKEAYLDAVQEDVPLNEHGEFDFTSPEFAEQILQTKVIPLYQKENEVEASDEKDDVLEEESAVSDTSSEELSSLPQPKNEKDI